MINFTVDISLYCILLIIGKNPIFGRECVLLHVAEGLIEAGIIDNFIDKTFNC